MQIKYDVVIIGGGINGLAVAKGMAQKDKKVLVIEKDHIASGASSHSSRLIHGGLRYLEHFEFSLVKEALNDQKYLLDSYPDLVKLRSFYLPIYKGSKRPAWMIKFGLWLYGFYSKHEKKALEVSKNDFLKKFKELKEENLKKVYVYFDGKTNDKLLTQTIAKEAQELGVDIIEKTEIIAIDINNDITKIETSRGIAKTNLLINATGAWVDETNEKFNLPSSFSIEKLSGIHLVVDRVLVPQPIILQTSTKRIFFIIPEDDTTLIGTTERSEDADVDKIKINNEDVEYLLNEGNKYLKKQLTRQDIKEVFIGVRPIIKSRKNPTKMSREYKLDLHQIGKNRILHVYGGKLTTFHSLSTKVVNLLG